MQKKEKQITFWTTKEEAAKLQRYAAKAGLSQSAYIRRASLKKPMPLKPSTSQVQIKQLLSRLGEEITGLAPVIGEREALRLRGMVYEAYEQYREGAGADGV